MMALDTYDNLKTAFIGQVHRKDLDTKFDDFLLITEVEIRSNPAESLKMNLAENISALTTSTVTRFLALPSDFQSSRKFSITIQSEYIQELTYRTPDQMNIRPFTGTPVFFTIRNNQIEFDVVSDVAYTVSVTYTADTPALTELNQTNIILTKYPTIYLFGCLKQGFLWSEDYEQSAIYDGLFSEAISSANMSESDIKYPTQPQETVGWSP